MSCFYYTLRLRYEEKHILVVAILKSNMALVTMATWVGLNYFKWSKVQLYQFSHFCQKSERFIQSLALSLCTTSPSSPPTLLPSPKNVTQRDLVLGALFGAPIRWWGYYRIPGCILTGSHHLYISSCQHL